MALKIHIPPCIDTPRHHYHPPPLGHPLRIHIQGPLVSIQKLIPDIDWTIEDWEIPDFLPGGAPLARLTYEALYGQALKASEKITVRNEYLGWIIEPVRKMEIDYYGVTFDYLVPEDEKDPEVLALNFIELDYDSGAFAREVLRFQVNPEDYTNKKVLAVPRCCQKKEGTQDHGRINGEVQWRISHGISDKLEVHGLLKDGGGGEGQ